jgi:hypothetical protein
MTTSPHRSTGVTSAHCLAPRTRLTLFHSRTASTIAFTALDPLTALCTPTTGLHRQFPFALSQPHQPHIPPLRRDFLRLARSLARSLARWLAHPCHCAR